MTYQRLHILAFSACCLMAIPSARADEKGPVFESDIQPVLAGKCGKCHSDTVRKGGLDLSSIGGIRQGGESGEAAVAETVGDSLLWTMIDGGDMPPEGQDPLTIDERDLIRRWIAAGSRSEKRDHTARRVADRAPAMHGLPWCSIESGWRRSPHSSRHATRRTERSGSCPRRPGCEPDDSKDRERSLSASRFVAEILRETSACF